MAEASKIQGLLVAAYESFVAGDIEASKKLLSSVLAVDPNSIDALHLRAAVAGTTGQHGEAEDYLKRALAVGAEDYYIFFNLGKALNEQRKYSEALGWHKKALRLRDDDENAFINFGLAQFNTGDIRGALESFSLATEVNQESFVGLVNKANCLHKLGENESALALYDLALALKPDLSEAWNNRGNVLRDLARLEDAKLSYEAAYKIKPSLEYLLGNLLFTQLKVCDWNHFDSRCSCLIYGLLNRQPVSSPFPLLGLLDDPSLQATGAKIFIASEFGEWRDEKNILSKAGGRIRLGYFSMDFRDHPVAHLIHDLIRNHDRSSFEVLAFSFGPVSDDDFSRRIQQTFDCFYDVRGLSDKELVQFVRDRSIDIAIDLAGHTQDSRPGIFLSRVAPIQIGYLGFPGSWGHECIDYIIGDTVVINKKNREFFSESIIYLPSQFQVSSDLGLPDSLNVSRGVYGLPEDGFMFCSFNNNWKINPITFDHWMSIMQQTSNTFMWIFCDNKIAESNLRDACKASGVSPERIIFTSRLPRLSYLAQYHCVDLFLDTFPYSGGATTIDALRMNVPVLTRYGSSYASRMSASLLTSIGVPELACDSWKNYVSKALSMVENKALFSEVKERIKIHNRTSAIDHSRATIRHLEEGYKLALSKIRSGRPREDLYVQNSVDIRKQRSLEA